MEAIRNMMQGNGNNGHDNMFRKLSLNELEEAAGAIWADIDAVEPGGSPGPADVYWMLGGCLHELQKRKGMSPDECIDYVCENLGFDERRPHYAMAIRDDYEDQKSVAGMTVQEAYDNPPKGKSEKRGKAKPRPRQVARKSGGNGARPSTVTAQTPESLGALAPRNYHGDAEGRVMASSDNNGKPSSPLEEWNRQLDVVRTLIISAAKGYRNGLGLYGPPGVGKTHTVQEILKELKMKWAEAPKGLTPQGLLEFFEEFGSGIMIFDDVAELFQKERARKYMMAAFGTRPDYTQPRIVPYAREGRKMSVTVAGCCFVMTNEERFPAAFASRITTLEFAPTQEQVAALMRDIASRGVRRDKWELSASESTEVAEFLIPEARAPGVRLDLRDLIEKSLPDYALCKAGWLASIGRTWCGRISWASSAS